jgi:hypothetical protein
MLERAADADRRPDGGAIVIEDPTALARPTRLDDGLWIDGSGNLVPTEVRGTGYARDDDGRLIGPIEHWPAADRIVGVR